MSRAIHKLTARAVATLQQPGRYSDGGGLYLFISDGGRRRWTFMYARGGKQRELGLGAAGNTGITLADARDFAANARALLKAGADPLDTKRSASRQAAASNAIKIPTFGDFADEHVRTKRPEWRSEKHAAQWAMTLTTHAALIRATPIDKVDTGAVLGLLRPLWSSRPETARRLRGRIENVLDAAKAAGLRSGENPARWRGHLKHLLPKRGQLTRGHHAALPFKAMSGLMSDLRSKESVSARALEFTILTVCRTGEALGARWSEFDIDGAIWTIPAIRMKAGRLHHVPLSAPVLAVLKEMAKMKSGEFVFRGRADGHLSNMAMAQTLARINCGDVTVHGFRSTFRDWAADTTDFPADVCEMALAHTIANKAEAAYRRGDMFEKRRELMAAWAAYCEPKDAEVASPRFADAAE